MPRMIAVILGCMGFLVALAPSWAQDVKGGRDHPAFSRMPGFYLDDYQETDFAAEEFLDPENPDAAPISVEGRKYYLSYVLKKGASLPSELQITRNYAQAVTTAGGSAYSPADHQVSMRLRRNGKEIWAKVETHSGGEGYSLNILEKKPMTQDVVVDASVLAKDIAAGGRVAVYGIYFDFDKADVKPESAPALQQIARLLTEHPQLKVFIVGHTDNKGNLEHNLKLSRARAEAVSMMLRSQYQISATRLAAFGVGPLAPVASNQDETGRARNRRVELVEQ